MEEGKRDSFANGRCIETPVKTHTLRSEELLRLFKEYKRDSNLGIFENDDEDEEEDDDEVGVVIMDKVGNIVKRKLSLKDIS